MINGKLTITRQLSLLDVETWRKAIRGILTPLAFVFLAAYDPSFIALFVLMIAAQWKARQPD